MVYCFGHHLPSFLRLVINDIQILDFVKRKIRVLCVITENAPTPMIDVGAPQRKMNLPDENHLVRVRRVIGFEFEEVDAVGNRTVVCISVIPDQGFLTGRLMGINQSLY